MAITTSELELIVESLLTEGVPTGVVARVFDLDHELVKEAQRIVRVRRYGTDDLSEYTEQLQWDAIDRARDLVANGSPAERNRVLGVLLGKQVALTGRRTPESQRRTQEAMIDALTAMRNGEPPANREPSKFIARPAS